MAEQRFTRSGAVYNARTEAPTIDDSCEWDQKLLSFTNTPNDDVTNRSGNRLCITNVPTYQGFCYQIRRCWEFNKLDCIPPRDKRLRSKVPRGKQRNFPFSICVDKSQIKS